MGTRDYRSEPFETMVVMGESTVAGGPWVESDENRWADVLARLIDLCQDKPVAYHNKGIGANAISPRSPGYAHSARPSALERYKDDIIALNPDLFILCYGLNDMRAGMDVEAFREDMQTIVTDVREACAPLIVLTTVYYMTGWRSFPPFDRGSMQQTHLYNECIRQLAEDNDALVAHVWEAEGQADWLINPDGVHANMVGNLVIAHRVFETLARHCSGLSVATHAKDADTDWTKQTTACRIDAGDPFQRTW
jgi:lysophospholipase L1-like esterase